MGSPFHEYRREILIEKNRPTKKHGGENAIKEYWCFQITNIFWAIITYKVVETLNEKQIKWPQLFYVCKRGGGRDTERKFKINAC